MKDMDFSSNRNIGNAGLSMAIAYFGSNGHTVSIPLNDTQDYDLVVDYDGTLKKVQVKATNNKQCHDAYQVQLRTVSGTTRKVCKTVKDTDIDLLFCLCGDGTMYLIPKESITNGSTLNLRKVKSKYAKKNIPDYSMYEVTV